MSSLKCIPLCLFGFILSVGLQTDKWAGNMKATEFVSKEYSARKHKEGKSTFAEDLPCARNGAMCAVTQLPLILCNPMDASPPCSSVRGLSRQQYWTGLPFPTPGKPGFLNQGSNPSFSSLLNLQADSLVAQKVKNLPAKQETWVQSLDGEDFLEKGKATHSSILFFSIN